MSRTRLLSLAATAALAAVASATTASAAPPSTGRDCVAGPSGVTRCFGSFREAIATASHGRLTDAPRSARRAAADPEVRRELRKLGRRPSANRSVPGRAAPRAIGDGSGEIIAATIFDDQDYGGGSFTITAGAPCKKDGWVEWTMDLPEEWRDRVSSVQPWGNCWIWIYPELGLTGERDGPFKENTPYVGARLDNRTKSIGLS